MKLLIAFLCLFPVVAIGGESEKDIAAEWKKLREELRKQGYPVAAYVETDEQVAQDIARVRREMERRAGKPFVSDMQKIGGGGGAPVKSKTKGK